jgi:hypothetical protein
MQRIIHEPGRKMIMAAPWTEACLTFPSLGALNEGYILEQVESSQHRVAVLLKRQGGLMSRAKLSALIA